MKPIPVICSHNGDPHRSAARVATVYGSPSSGDLRVEASGRGSLVHTPSDLIQTEGAGTDQDPVGGEFAAYEFRCVRCGRNPRLADWEIDMIVQRLHASHTVIPIDVSRLDLFGLRGR